MLYVDGWLSEVIGLLRSPSVLITREGKKAFYESKLCPSIQFGEKNGEKF